MFQGTISALVTPFAAGSADEPQIDFAAFAELIEWQLEAGVSGFVICGTTGESATLTDDEKLKLFKRAVEVVNKRVPVIAGTGTNSTRASVDLTLAAKAIGVDAALAVSPYYNKPTQEGLAQHFTMLADRGGLPVVIYNIPGRTSVEISVATFGRLANHPQLVAIKQAVDSTTTLLEVAAEIGDRMTLLAGDDPLTYAVMTLGGKGVISASASVIPREMAAITEAALAGDFKTALSAQKEAMPYIRALFLETNPAPAKAALKLLGRIKSDQLRLPLVGVSKETLAVLEQLFGSEASGAHG